MSRAGSARGRYSKFAGCGSCGNSALKMGKPFLVGLTAALAVSMLLVMTFAVVLVVMKSIVTSAVIPLSVVALMLGCFAGGWVCGSISRSRGLLYGLVIGLTVFVGAWVIGIAMGEDTFSLTVALKLVLLLLAGGCGGWIGSHRVKPSRRR